MDSSNVSKVTYCEFWHDGEHEGYYENENKVEEYVGNGEFGDNVGIDILRNR